MPIVVACKSCGKKLKAPDHLSGKRVRCKCGGAIAVPASAAVEPGELDLIGLTQGESLDQPKCPSCGGSMATAAILCVHCGFNRKTGARMNIDAGVPATADSGDVEKPKKKKKTAASKSDRPPSALPGTIVKVVLLLLLVGGFGWATLKIVESVTFDPTAQRDSDMLKISPAMTVYQVVDAMGRPPKDILTDRDPSKADNVVKFIPKKLFWSSDFMDKYSKDDLKYGFQMIYKYTEREELIFWFDETGKLMQMEKHDPMAMIWGR